MSSPSSNEIEIHPLSSDRQRIRLKYRLAIILLLVLTCLFLSAARTVQVAKAGRVTHVSGAANVKKSQVIGPGGRIKTGSNGRVELTFANGHRLRIGPASDIQLVAYDGAKNQTLLHLHKGRAWNNVKPGQKSKVVVRTRYSTASVLGTIYDTNLGGLTTKTTVVHGTVGVHQPENEPLANLFDKLPALPTATATPTTGFQAPTEISSPVHEVEAPMKMVPGPYEVSRDQWVQIVANQEISMGENGKAQISTIDPKQLEKTDEWFRWNQQMDKQSPQVQN